MKRLTLAFLILSSPAFALDFQGTNGVDGTVCNLTAEGTAFEDDTSRGELLIQYGEGLTTLWLTGAQEAPTMSLENERNRVAIAGGAVDENTFAAQFDVGYEAQLARFLSRALDMNSLDGRFFIDLEDSDTAIAQWLQCVNSTR